MEIANTDAFYTLDGSLYATVKNVNIGLTINILNQNKNSKLSTSHEN